MSASMESESLQHRLDCLQELTEFTEKCRKRLNDIFDALGWSWNYEDANKVRELRATLAPRWVLFVFTC